jgi:hypothetical protein
VTYQVVSRPLFALGQMGPNSAEVVQGTLGDCFFDATLLSAVNDAQIAAQLISQVTPNTYKVRFFTPGADSAPVHVAVDNQLPVYSDGSLQGDRSGGANGSLWAPLVEKAFAKYNDAFGVLYAGNTSGYNTLNAGGANEAQKPLTGYTSVLYATPSMFPAALWATLGMASNGLGVVIGTQLNATDLVGKHAYAVTGTSIDAAGRGMVGLRNPWGVNASLSFEKFGNNVADIWFTPGGSGPA